MSNPTKAALRQMWLQQRDDRINTHVEEIVFGLIVSQIISQVKGRQPWMDRENYKEKMDKSSAPMEVVRHIGAIETSFFTNGISRPSGVRVIHVNLRDWFTFLATLCGLLCGKTLFKAELSDVFRALVQKEDDPHPLFVMTMKFATGKVNQGIKLYGRVARYFDVNLCPIRALGFYLLYQFRHSKEIEELDFFP